MTTVAIDGDVLLYKAGFAGEKRTIVCTKNGKSVEFQNRTKFKEWLKDYPQHKYEEFEIKDVQTPDKLENTLHTCKLMVQGLVEKLEADEVEVYIGKGKSFRHYFDLPSMYKGNRTDIKPVHFEACKEYLIKYHGAIEVEGIEADDQISIRQWEGYQKWYKTQSDKDKVIACTIDKDAYSNQGWLYNWDKMQEPQLIEGYGELFIDEKNKVRGYGGIWALHQCLCGDLVDNLKPSEIAKIKFGEKSSYNVLKDTLDHKGGVLAVAEQYRLWYPEPVTYKTWDEREVTKTWEEIMDMYWRSVFMLRKYHELDHPSKLSSLYKTFKGMIR